MKKAVLLTMMLVLIVASSSCINGVPTAFFRDKDNDFVDARMEQLFHAMKEQDKDAFREMFSEKAVVQSGNLDDGIDYLLSFVQGEVVSWNRDESPIVFDRMENGRKSKQLIIWCTLHTDGQNYLVFLVDYPIDTIDPENAGLYSLRIIREEDADKLVGTLEEWVIPGIYIPDNMLNE